MTTTRKNLGIRTACRAITDLVLNSALFVIGFLVISASLKLCLSFGLDEIKFFTPRTLDLVIITITIFALSGWFLLHLKCRLIELLAVFGLGLTVIFFAAWISLFFIDHSFDGHAYHADAIRCLSNFVHPYDARCDADIQAKHFPTIGWSIASIAVALTNEPNASNLLSLLAFPFIICVVMVIWAQPDWPKISKTVLSVGLVLNPILLLQFWTRMNDGVGYALCSLLVLSVGLLLHRGTKGTSTAFHLVCCTTVLLAGLKFSTFVAVVFFLIATCLLACVVPKSCFISNKNNLQLVLNKNKVALFLWAIFVVIKVVDLHFTVIWRFIFHFA